MVFSCVQFDCCGFNHVRNNEVVKFQSWQFIAQFIVMISGTVPIPMTYGEMSDVNLPSTCCRNEKACTLNSTDLRPEVAVFDERICVCE